MKRAVLHINEGDITPSEYLTGEYDVVTRHHNTGLVAVLTRISSTPMMSTHIDSSDFVEHIRLCHAWNVEITYEGQCSTSRLSIPVNDTIYDIQ